MDKIRQIAGLEWRYLSRRPVYVALALLVPFLYALIFCTVYHHKQLKNIPILVIDYDHSALSREIIDAFAHCPAFKLSGYASSPQDFVAEARRGRACLGLVFPAHLERDIKSGKGGKVEVLMDASNIVIGNTGINQATEILGIYNAGIEKKSLPLNSSYLPGRLNPLKLETLVWYNPAFNYNYADYLVPGLIAIGIQLLTLLVLAGSGDYRGRQADWENLKVLSPCVRQVILGKLAAYLLLMYPANLIAALVPYPAVGIPFRGSLLLFALWLLWFMFFLILVGLGIALFLGESLLVTEIFAILVMPAFLLSGFTWPGNSMPLLLRLLSYSLPMTPLLLGLQKISLAGSGLNAFGELIVSMTVWTLLGLLLAGIGGYKLLKSGGEEA